MGWVRGQGWGWAGLVCGAYALRGMWHQVSDKPLMYSWNLLAVGRLRVFIPPGNKSPCMRHVCVISCAHVIWTLPLANTAGISATGEEPSCAPYQLCPLACRKCAA